MRHSKMRYSPTLGTMSKESRLALAALDLTMAMGFHAGLYRSSSWNGSIYLVVHHRGGSGYVRISDYRQPAAVRDDRGEPILDIDTATLAMDAALRRLGAALQGLEQDEGASMPRRLPAEFCGRL